MRQFQGPFGPAYLAPCGEGVPNIRLFRMKFVGDYSGNRPAWFWDC